MDTVKRPWYRTPYVWMLIGIPLSAVIMGGFLLYFAITSYDGLVVDDYYKQGKEINLVIERDHAATELGLYGSLQLEQTKGTVHLTLKSRKQTTLPDKLELAMLHATRAGFDREITLERTPDGNYFAILPALQPGRWYTQIGTSQWRLTGSLKLPGDDSVIFAP
jgi:hypothetical protein